MPAPRSNIAARAKLPYGVMVWGDFRKYRLPQGVSAGAAIVGDAGLFLPMVLDVGKPAEVTVVLAAQ